MLLGHVGDAIRHAMSVGDAVRGMLMYFLEIL